LLFDLTLTNHQGMGFPTEPLTLTVEQITELNKKLSTMRHNVNNNLALIVAAIELIRRKPDMALKLVENMSTQPDKMNDEIQRFSAEFEKAFQISREKITDAAGRS
jgi:hypothetical protein